MYPGTIRMAMMGHVQQGSSCVVASKSRIFSACAMLDEVSTEISCHPTRSNVGNVRLCYRTSVDNRSAVIVAAPGDNIILDICELSSVALNLLRRLCAAWGEGRPSYFNPEDDIFVHYIESPTVMEAVNVEAAAPYGNATTQKLVSVVRALIKEVKHLGWNLVFHSPYTNLEATPLSRGLPTVQMYGVRLGPPTLPDTRYPSSQITHTLSVWDTTMLINDELPQGFRDFANPESIGIEIEPPLRDMWSDRLSDPDWCRECGVPVTPRDD